MFSLSPASTTWGFWRCIKFSEGNWVQMGDQNITAFNQIRLDRFTILDSLFMRGLRGIDLDRIQFPISLVYSDINDMELATFPNISIKRFPKLSSLNIAWNTFQEGTNLLGLTWKITWINIADSNLYSADGLELFPSLQWHHNDHDSVSNHQPHGCLLNRLFGRRSKKTSKLRVTGLCAGNSSGPVNSPHKGPVTRNMFPFVDVIMYLDYLSITNNKLETQPDLLGLPVLSKMLINGNSRMSCDKRMCWRHLWHRLRDPLYLSDDVTCVEPPLLAGYDMLRVNPKFMQCNNGK